MSELLTPISTGLGAFVATNIDDILILTLLFAQVTPTFRHRHIVFGQYLGFILLIIVSLPGFFGSFIFPFSSVKLLGLLPIFIGLNSLFEEDDEEDSVSIESEIKPTKFSFLSPQTYTVAAITIANGSDNIGVYVPLFANSNLESLLVILGVFLTLVGFWCYIAYKLTSLTAIAELVTSYGNTFVPCILIGLGVFIIKENILLSLIALAVSYLWAIALRNNPIRSS
jgi:cadmium resistance transport/sequestration family protein